jgi:hypothetical protein
MKARDGSDHDTVHKIDQELILAAALELLLSLRRTSTDIYLVQPVGIAFAQLWWARLDLQEGKDVSLQVAVARSLLEAVV